MHACDRGIAWSAFWSCVSIATACYGSMILTVFIRYNSARLLWDEAMRDGEQEPAPDSIARVDSEFASAITAFTAIWLVSTVAAALVFVALSATPLCRGRRHAT